MHQGVPAGLYSKTVGLSQVQYELRTKEYLEAYFITLGLYPVQQSICTKEYSTCMEAYSITVGISQNYTTLSTWIRFIHGDLLYNGRSVRDG